MSLTLSLADGAVAVPAAWARRRLAPNNKIRRTLARRAERHLRSWFINPECSFSTIDFPVGVKGYHTEMRRPIVFGELNWTSIFLVIIAAIMWVWWRRWLKTSNYLPRASRLKTTQSCHHTASAKGPLRRSTTSTQTLGENDKPLYPSSFTILIGLPQAWHGAGAGSSNDALVLSDDDENADDDAGHEKVQVRAALPRGQIHEVMLAPVAAWHDVKLALARKMRRNPTSFTMYYENREPDPRAQIPPDKWTLDLDLVAVQGRRDPTPRPSRGRSRSRPSAARTTRSVATQTSGINTIERVDVVTCDPQCAFPLPPLALL